MRPPFFESGTHFGVPRGPWRSPGGSKNLPKQCIWLWLLPMPRNGLNKAQSWLNITEHIQGDMLKAFQPLESATGGCKKHLKNCQFWLKMAYFDDSGALQWPFFGALMVQTDPPEGVWQCSTLFNQRSTHLCLLEASMVKKLHFWAQKGHFWRLWSPPATLFGDPKGPNWPPWVCLTMFNLVQLKFNPFGFAKGVYGQEYAVLGQNGHFRRFQGPPVTLFEGPKGPNRPPWVFLTMFNLVQPMFNPFGSTRGVYGQEMAFLSKNGQFWRFWGPLVTLFGGSKGPNRPPRMCWTMFNLVQPMFNPFGSARAVYGQEIAFLGQKRPFLAIKLA